MKEKNTTDQATNEALDGPVAAPEHHKVVFENDRVRVVDFRVPAGDTVPLHTHRYATVNYVISTSDFRSFDCDGNLKHDSRKEESAHREGGVFCLPAFPPLHSVENVGCGEIRGVTVELKD
jgi:hypothetical protein